MFYGISAEAYESTSLIIYVLGYWNIDDSVFGLTNSLRLSRLRNHTTCLIWKDTY